MKMWGVLAAVALSASADTRRLDTWDSLFTKTDASKPSHSTSTSASKVSKHSSASSEDLSHDMLAKMFKAQEERKARYKKAGGNPEHYLNVPPEQMDNIIKDIELTLNDHAKMKKERAKMTDLENKEAMGVKDRSAEGANVLVHEAEESLADKEASDPLLADPLLSLEEDHEEDERLKSSIDKVEGSIHSVSARRRFDPDLFKEDSIRAMDTDGDGLLSKKELLAHLEKMVDIVRKDELKQQKKANADGIQEVMDQLDDNKDGFVDKSELFGKTTQTDAQKRSDARMFEFADHNKDGKLNPDEVFMMALPQYWPNKQEWYDFKAGDHMDTMDTNQDGFVDWDEYSSEMKRVIDGWDEGIGDNVKAHFDFADKDHNGKLNQKEMSALIGNMDKGFMQSVVDEMMKIGDTHTVDGKLSLAEIISHAKDFGSNIEIFMENPSLLFVKGVGSQHNDKFVSKALRDIKAPFKSLGKTRKASHYPKEMLNQVPLDSLKHYMPQRHDMFEALSKQVTGPP